jgi:PTH1 family peptidyl-tRNA hydrolase
MVLFYLLPFLIFVLFLLYVIWLFKHFSPKKAQDNTNCMKPEVHEPQNNTIKNVSKKFLIVGLGNIGAEYVNTRHNIGFKILDFFAKKEAISFETVKLGSLAEFKFKGRKLFFF